MNCASARATRVPVRPTPIMRKFLLKSPEQQAFARHGVAAYQAFWDQLEELS